MSNSSSGQSLLEKYFTECVPLERHLWMLAFFRNNVRDESIMFPWHDCPEQFPCRLNSYFKEIQIEKKNFLEKHIFD